MKQTKNGKVVSFNKWGYFFLIPFILTYLFFQLVPLVLTFYYSFIRYFEDGLTTVNKGWNNFGNYAYFFTQQGGRLANYGLNTIIMWIIGFIPQILVSLLLGAWFSDARLRLKAAAAYKVIIYLPNLIMASAFSLLFFALFKDTGPIHGLMAKMGMIGQTEDLFKNVWFARSLIGFMNFLMWFGNTTILLMAGMLGIDQSLYEAAEVDGATPTQVFWRITLPLLRPILVYVLLTSLIGGLQMFDVPQVLTQGKGGPSAKNALGANDTTMTLIMWLNRFTGGDKDYGKAGALSVILFIITGVLSMIVYKVSAGRQED